MTEVFLFWSLSFALFYLLAVSVILIRNRFDLTELDEAPAGKDDNLLQISICIPARNEENNIGLLLDSIFEQTRDPYEIHVLDDQSSDYTSQILEAYRHNYPDKLRVHPGTDAPAGWLGKLWACHLLSKEASGDYILFLDADTRLHPSALERIAATLHKSRLDMLTVWPRQITLTFWEKTVIPLVYHALVTLLPAVYVTRSPRWLPARFKTFFDTRFAAACGQCIAFRMEAYKKIDGHESVKDKVVEDVALARKAREHHLAIRMFLGMETISCRMYRNEKEIFQGFRKNFLAGFNHSIPLFLVTGIVQSVVYLLPFLTLFVSFFLEDFTIFFLSVSCVALILLHRLMIALWFRWDPVYAFTHPVGVLWCIRLGMVKLADYFADRKVYWKGREV